MFWAQYLSTVQNDTLKSNCLVISHFVIKNFILSSMKMLKELFIDWSVSIYQCKTKIYKKACYDNSAVWPVQNTGTQQYNHQKPCTDSCFVPASTHWYSIGFRQEYAKNLVACMCILLNFSFVWLYLLYCTPCCVWIRWICACWSAAAWCWNLELLLLELQHRSLVLLWFLSNWHGKVREKIKLWLIDYNLPYCSLGSISAILYSPTWMAKNNIRN